MIRRALFSLKKQYSRRSASAVAGGALLGQRIASAVPTNIDLPLRIPMTLIDFHLRDEQLPFAYFFHETLDFSQLESSLSRVLQRYPILGGTINLRDGVIECHPGDSVSLSFGQSELSLQQWLADAPPQHLHLGRQRFSSLSCLFDCLQQHHGEDEVSNDSTKQVLASIRVTHFEGGGTALGVNLSHALADAASCIRFVECWGREMQNLNYPNASNQRADATCSGMLSPELLDLLDLSDKQKVQNEWSLGALLLKCGVDWEDKHDDKVQDRKDDTEKYTHEYVSLSFPPPLLEAMKAHGMSHCAGSGTKFVSTNDMVTAFGWLMKRHLSGRPDWNMSMVINLRGRCGVNDFSHIDDTDGFGGVFGNGITNIVATLPSATTKDDRNHGIQLDDISAAAVTIRAALIAGLSEIPHRLVLSKLGRPGLTPTSSTSFASTSWQHFPVFDISFSPEGQLAAFHGQPSHPLPEGDTFSSIIVPLKCGGHTYQLLAPSNKVQEAESFHKDMCSLFLQWYDEHNKKEQLQSKLT